MRVTGSLSAARAARIPLCIFVQKGGVTASDGAGTPKPEMLSNDVSDDNTLGGLI